nr:unnamed protein product [Timema douglasi]
MVPQAVALLAGSQSVHLAICYELSRAKNDLEYRMNPGWFSGIDAPSQRFRVRFPYPDSGLFIAGLPVCGSEGDSELNLKKLNLPCLEKITQASCCKNHILTVTETGNCWQYLTDTGTWKQISNFAATETSSSVRIVNVCCSETLNIALSESGMVYSIPVALSTPSTEKVVQVACGLEHCLLLTATGQVFSWGTGT